MDTQPLQETIEQLQKFDILDKEQVKGLLDLVDKNNADIVRKQLYEIVQKELVARNMEIIQAAIEYSRDLGEIVKGSGDPELALIAEKFENDFLNLKKKERLYFLLGNSNAALSKEDFFFQSSSFITDKTNRWIDNAVFIFS